MGAEAQNRSRTHAALKGRSSTVRAISTRRSDFPSLLIDLMCSEGPLFLQSCASLSSSAFPLQRFTSVVAHVFHGFFLFWLGRGAEAGFPVFLDGRRELVHVGEEHGDLPSIGLGEGLVPGGHAGV